MLLITHDFGFVAEMADRVGIMYAGKIVEYGSLDDLFSRPAHPYTVGLLNSIPSMKKRGEKLNTIPGKFQTYLNFLLDAIFRNAALLQIYNAVKKSWRQLM